MTLCIFFIIAQENVQMGNGNDNVLGLTLIWIVYSEHHCFICIVFCQENIQKNFIGEMLVGDHSQSCPLYMSVFFCNVGI